MKKTSWQKQVVAYLENRGIECHVSGRLLVAVKQVSMFNSKFYKQGSPAKSIYPEIMKSAKSVCDSDTVCLAWAFQSDDCLYIVNKKV